MLKDLLKIDGVSQIDKEEQLIINGGAPGDPIACAQLAWVYATENATGYFDTTEMFNYFYQDSFSNCMGIQ